MNVECYQRDVPSAAITPARVGKVYQRKYRGAFKICRPYEATQLSYRGTMAKLKAKQSIENASRMI
jgi:hypothetical protein